jgi:hypothetical protein
MAVKPHPQDHAVAKVAHVLDLRREVGVDVQEALPPVPDTVVAAIRPAPVYLQPVRNELDVGVTESEERIEVAPVEGVIRTVEKVHVLLRHHYSDSPAWSLLTTRNRFRPPSASKP